MINLNKLKIGDVIVRFGQVYKVFKIEKKDDKSMIFYKKLVKNLRHASSIFSIPQKSIEKTKIRPPISKKELDALLGPKLKAFEVDLTINLNTIKAVLNTDEPEDVVKMLKNLTAAREAGDGKLPFSKREVYDSLLNRLASEVAFVYDETEEKAKEIINQALEKSLGKK